MKALRIEKPHDYSMVEVPTPKPEKNQTLVRVSNCGICGSDVDIVQGERPLEVTAYPLIMGHEFSAVVEEPGNGVSDFKKGDKVAVNTIMGCGQCENCLRGWVCHCLKEFQQLGCTKPGGMAEFCAVRNDLLYKLPSEMDMAVAALAEPTGCSAHGVSKADIQPGDSVVILGCGPIGALALQVARLFSPSKLIMVEVDEKKFEKAQKLGATHTINAAKQDVAAEVKRITNGRGANAIIDCTGNMAAIKQTADYVAAKGRIVIIGVPPKYDLEIGFMKMLFQDAMFRASNGYTIPIWIWTLGLLRDGKIDAETIITHHLPLARAGDGLNIIEKRTEPAIKVMLDI